MKFRDPAAALRWSSPNAARLNINNLKTMNGKLGFQWLAGPPGGLRTYEGKTVWEGVVMSSIWRAILGPTRAYAWSSHIEGSDKRRFFAVLHTGAIKSPRDAVRAAIVAEHKQRSR